MHQEAETFRAVLFGRANSDLARQIRNSPAQLGDSRQKIVYKNDSERQSTTLAVTANPHSLGAKMQITQELKMHATDMRNTVGSLRAARFPKWLVVLLVLIAFVLGWLGGFYRGFADGDRLGDFGEAFHISIAAKKLADGNPFYVEKFHAQIVDHLVRAHVAERNEGWAQKALRMMSPIYWQMRDGELLTHDIVVKYAEQRLLLVPTARSETISESLRLGGSGKTNTNMHLFDATAKAYSVLLGREIRGEQLVPDAYLREDNQTRARIAADNR